jgi:ribosome-associated toxin RatA of RatAB toxin-antitoxin module
MPTVTIDARSTSLGPDEVFRRISDFPRYAEYTEAVREVHIDRTDGDVVTSTWLVNFRNGVLRWTERDRIDAQRRTIDFEQLEGDFAEFTGSWQVQAAGEATALTFSADFDLGMPSLAAMIDPIAEQALRDNMRLILRGLLGDDVTVVDEQMAEAPR